MQLLGVARMIHYPSVYQAFYVLFSQLIIKNPAKLARMKPQDQSKFSECVLFALKHADAKVARTGLNALRAMTLAIVRSGTSSSSSSSPSADNVRKLDGMQRYLFKMLLQDSLAKELVDPIADALFPLIVASPNTLNDVARTTIGTVAPADRDTVQRGFKQLLNANGLKRELSPDNRARFRANVLLFLANVRSVLQKK